MSGSPSTSSSESSLKIYAPLIPFADEDDKSNLDFGYAPANRRHARRPSRGLVGIWKDVTRKLRKPERASVLPPGFELVAEQRRRSRMLQQIAERNPGLIANVDRSVMNTHDRSPSLSTSSSRSGSSSDITSPTYAYSYSSLGSRRPTRPPFMEQHQRNASYPVLARTPRSADSGYNSPPRSASLYRSEWYE